MTIEEIRAKNFVLVDENDKMRAELGVEDLGPRLVLFDELQNPRVVLAAFKGGHGLQFLEGDNLRAMLTVIDKQGPMLGLADKRGTMRASLIMDEKKGPMLGLFDSDGTHRAGVAVTEGKSKVVLFDKKGNPREVIEC